jgi:hypothetical protein
MISWIGRPHLNRPGKMLKRGEANCGWPRQSPWRGVAPNRGHSGRIEAILNALSGRFRVGAAVSMTSTRAASVLPGGQRLSRNSPMRDRDLSMDAKTQAGAIQPGLRAHILNWCGWRRCLSLSSACL